MYEAVVLKKDILRKYGSTPAGRLIFAIKCMVPPIITGGCIFICDFFIKKKELIDEFNESNSKEFKLYEEYVQSMTFWDNSVFNNITAMVFGKDSKKIIAED
ncbi:hypothetical protein WN48_00430 [Eufriesea mexicana]|nr:hypothetical protein WN48_00430 [Eufriesea mexicana]